MKEFKSLKYLDKIKNLYTRFGVNYDIMRLIISTKLTMDTRRTPTLMANSNNAEKENKLSTALYFYVFMGFFMGLFIFLPISELVKMTIFFGMFMFLIGTVFISDFSYVLLDVRDKNILGTKAISSKTINAAKITHICIYILQITLAFCGFSIIFSLKNGPIFTIVFILEILLLDIFMILLTALVYFLILKFFDGEKLKDIINMIQIILSVVIFFAYQLITRAFSFIDSSASLTDKLWTYFLPSLWFAAPLEIISSGKITTTLIICTALSILIPLISIFVYIKISNTFEYYIQKLNNNTYKAKNKIAFSQKISKLICPNPYERSFFNFTVNLIKGERNFKLKTYPSLGMAAFFPLLFFIFDLPDYNSFAEFKSSLVDSKSYLFIYFSIAILSTACLMCKYSDNYKSAWIYRSVPIKNPALIYKGVFKGTFYKLLLPPMVALTILFIYFFNIDVLIKLIPSFLNLLIVSLISFTAMDKYLPFSIDFKESNNMDDIGISLLSFIITPILAGINFGFLYIPYGIYILILIQIPILIFLWKISFKKCTLLFK